MIHEEKQKFSNFLLAIGDMFDRKVSETQVMLYFQTLRDLDFNEIQEAVKRHCQDPKRGHFFPLPADIIAKIPRKNVSALSAWASVTEALCKYNTYDSVQFVDKTINAVIRSLGGWVKLSRDMGTDQETWNQKDFERLYEDFKNRGVELDERLPGLMELNNRGSGYLDQVPDTHIIGAEGQCLRLDPIPERRQLAPAPEENSLDTAVKGLAEKFEMNRNK